MANQSDLKYELLLRSSPTQVYRAFTNSTDLREWLCDGATVDPKPGGRMVAWWHDGYVSAGSFLELVPDQRIAFTWKGRPDPAETQVLIVLVPHERGTSLTLVHSGLGESAEWENTRAEFKRAWESSLENLQSVLETGMDLRIYRRPMLGILLNDFNAEIAAAHGIPVASGVRLDDTIEGMGARAAGLQKDDVIVGMADQAVQGFEDLRDTLQGKRAGDTVAVEFYRGAQKQTVQMTLSGRPVPEVPWNAAQLAEQVAEFYVQSDAELWAAIADIGEEAASAKPSPKEWNAKEVLAHLIISERDTTRFIAELVDEREPWTDNPGSNVQAPIDAILAVYPTKQALFDELKRCEAETVAIIRALPPEFLERKGSYFRMADAMLTFRSHSSTHIPQILAAAAAAK